MADFHPAFNAADRAHRWTGRLPELRRTLDREAVEIAPRWTYRVLPHGACVAVRSLEGTREVRISRGEAPAPHAVKKWDHEISIFVRELKLVGWASEQDRAAAGVAMLFRCDERLLCRCGAKRDENALLFDDSELCRECRVALTSGSDRREALDARD